MYAGHAEIILVRSEGRMLSVVSQLGTDGDAEVTPLNVNESHPDIEYHLRAAGLDAAALASRVVEVLATWTDSAFCDASVGVAQGDPVATDFCCTPTHSRDAARGPGGVSFHRHSRPCGRRHVHGRAPQCPSRVCTQATTRLVEPAPPICVCQAQVSRAPLDGPPAA